MRAILTVVGKDRVGIIAGVCVALAQKNVNVLDISQTILQDMFTMIMLIDVSKASVGFSELTASLDAVGDDLGVNIRMQQEEVFNAMHRI